MCLIRTQKRWRHLTAIPRVTQPDADICLTQVRWVPWRTVMCLLPSGKTPLFMKCPFVISPLRLTPELRMQNGERMRDL